MILLIYETSLYVKSKHRTLFLFVCLLWEVLFIVLDRIQKKNFKISKLLCSTQIFFEKIRNSSQRSYSTKEKPITECRKPKPVTLAELQQQYIYITLVLYLFYFVSLFYRNVQLLCSFIGVRLEDYQNIDITLWVVPFIFNYLTKTFIIELTKL